MTPREVLDALAASRAQGGDDETQHILEDALRAAVLTTIAEGTEQPQLLASAALASSAIEFSRWSA